jgi:hypothetical protein
VAGTTVQPAVSLEEVPSPAAKLTIVLEPYQDGSPPEAPTSAAKLTVAVKPYSDSSTQLARCCLH